MLFRKSLNRELTYTSIGVFSILFAILLSTQTINMLGRAAQGLIASDAIFAMVGFWSIGFFPLLMILTIFVSVIVVLTRMWREQEMAVWMASGKSLTDWVAPVLRFALPLCVLVAVGTTMVGPWAAQRSKEYAETMKQREDMTALAPGVFKESGNGERVYFIESYSVLSGATRNVFLQITTRGQVSSIFAKEGQVSYDEDGNRVLMLKDGRRYIGEPGSANYEVMEFKRYTLKMVEAARLIHPPVNSDGKSTLELLHSDNPSDRAELAWRFSMPLGGLVLALLAVPLSYYNPRQGHAYNLVFALGAYLLYQNLLWSLRSAINSGKIASSLGILPAHLVMLALAVLLLRYYNRPARPMLQRLKNLLQRQST
ncbi:LPS export ABC transporter permease LptF [Vogesella sp. LIG4]|uniref:LPS export ABC transporter permease LptF n=1 Tax=Vogesella sp. LIG4 TaxID=1192162 RepID=UPI00081FC054|nr:LPS export ABC transporter permease LptF [Vogesella sp. LIG4]SCK25219.1 lipopolysaccharide export system permease protein [Vogesella sp. LIG4]